MWDRESSHVFPLLFLACQRKGCNLKCKELEGKKEMAYGEGDHNVIGGIKESYKNRKRIKIALNYFKFESKYVGRNCMLSK